MTKQSDRLFGGSIGSGPTTLTVEWLFEVEHKLAKRSAKSGNTMGGKGSKHDKEVILIKRNLGLVFRKHVDKAFKYSGGVHSRDGN